MAGFDYPVEEVVVSINAFSVNRTIADFRKFLRESQRKIPKKYRSTASIVFDEEYFDGSPSYHFQVTYTRPPTPEEVAGRRRVRSQEIARQIDALKRLHKEALDIGAGDPSDAIGWASR